MGARESHRIPVLTLEEYLELEKTSPVRHEYVGGELHAFAGASERHNRIAGNVYAFLWTAARGGPCRVFMSDMKLQVSEDQVYYPDVFVTCDPNDNDPYVKKNPCLVVEILSPSTESMDRREKLIAYRSLPELEAYVILYQDQKRAIRHVRDEHGAWWRTEVASEGLVTFPFPALELSLSEIYEGIDFSSS